VALTVAITMPNYFNKRERVEKFEREIEPYSSEPQGRVARDHHAPPTKEVSDRLLFPLTLKPADLHSARLKTTTKGTRRVNPRTAN